MHAEHWAKLSDGKTIPVCLSLSCSYGDLPGTSYKVNLKNPDYPDVKFCMKLLQNGCNFHQVSRSIFIKNPKEDLKAFLFHRITLYLPAKEKRKEKLIKETKYFEFKKNQIATRMAETFYLSDENGIALLHVKGWKVRCCYLNTDKNEVAHRTINYTYSNSVARLSDNVLWFLSWVDDAKISFMHILVDKEVKPVSGYYHLSFIPWIIKTPKKSTETLLVSISTSKMILFANLCTNYIYVNNERSSCAHKEIPHHYGPVARFYLVCNSMFVAKEKVENGVPKVYIIKVWGKTFTENVIDLSQDLIEYNEYAPSSFEMTVNKACKLLLLTATEGYIVCIDLRLGKIFQILSYVNCFWSHTLSIKFSWKDDEIWLIGEQAGAACQDYIYIKFKVWRGLSLVNLTLNMISRCLQTNYQKQKIPQHLQHLFTGEESFKL